MCVSHSDIVTETESHGTPRRRHCTTRIRSTSGCTIAGTAGTGTGPGGKEGRTYTYLETKTAAAGPAACADKQTTGTTEQAQPNGCACRVRES